MREVLAGHFGRRSFGVPEMAAKLRMSERQLQRKVRELVGCTPAQYLRGYRLRASLPLLEAGGAVGEVADAVGFSSHAYFTSCFKAAFGTTPSRFREGCRGGASPG